MVAVRGFVMIVERQPDPEVDRDLYSPEYRALFATMLPYMAVILTAAAFCRANPAYLGGKELSVIDAVYFSVVTITTIGYGDLTPKGCLRLVAMWEVLAGMFILVVIVASTVGIFGNLFARRGR